MVSETMGRGSERTLKTLSRKDPDFAAYLDGSFSKSARALPVRSLNVGTQQERVTFEILPLSLIRRPSLLLRLASLVRASALILSIGPLATIICFCLARHLSFNGWIAFSSAVGVLSLHVSVHLFNDYADHVRGRDRLRVRGGSRVIQNGWLTARTVRRCAWAGLALAVLGGGPALLQPPTQPFAQSIDGVRPVWIAFGIAGLVSLEFAFQRLRLATRGWNEILAFLLTGPLLTLGFSAAISGRLLWAEAVLGALFGAQSLMALHAANFENIMIDSQARVTTWATRAGFDASKNFFYFTAALSGFSLFVYASFFEHSRWFIAPLLVHVSILMLLCERVRNIASPLSSRLMGLRRAVYLSCWITTLALVVVFLVRARAV